MQMSPTVSCPVRFSCLIIPRLSPLAKLNPRTFGVEVLLDFSNHWIKLSSFVNTAGKVSEVLRLSSQIQTISGGEGAWPGRCKRDGKAKSGRTVNN